VFNIPDTQTTTRQNYFGGRVDFVLSQNSRLMVRGSGFTFDVPAQGVGTSHPSTWGFNNEESAQGFVSWTRTWGSKVNELRVGYTGFNDELGKLVPGVVPTVVLAGNYTIGRTLSSLLGGTKVFSVRNDFTLFRGRHELKMGGDFFLPSNRLYYGNNNNGTLDASVGPVPANIGDLFPVWNDPTTWFLDPLSPISRGWTQAIGEFEIHCVASPDTCRRRKPDVGAWFQDNWNVNAKLTLNLGVRWDFSKDGMGQDFVYPYVQSYPGIPAIKEKQPQELTNFGPRIGGAYALDEKTVFRGGWGLYFAGITDRNAHASYINLANGAYQVLNDGRPNFASDPYNLAGGGQPPTPGDVENQARGQLRGTPSLIYNAKTPYSYQTSVGVQRQLGPTLSVQADYVWVGIRREPAARNINLSFDPATGVNFPFTDVSRRPYPLYGAINVWLDDSYSNYHGLETALIKRFSNRWQGGITYTLAKTSNYYPEPINPGCAGPINGLTMTCETYFRVAEDLGGEYGVRGAGGVQTLSEPDQRHRLVFNGVYELPRGLQVSGLYIYSSGIRQTTTFGSDVRNTGLAEYGGGRLRADGTIIPRNSVVDDPIHRVDLRIQGRIRSGRVLIMPLAEVFNLFNSENFIRNWVELSPFYTQPIGQSVGSGYRVVQLGVRTQF
jgi:hypothetical protein